MAESVPLSGRVTEDAVPLESSVTEGVNQMPTLTAVPRPPAVRGSDNIPLQSIPRSDVQHSSQYPGGMSGLAPGQSQQQSLAHTEADQSSLSLPYHSLPSLSSLQSQSESAISHSQGREEETSVESDVLKGVEKAVGKVVGDSQFSIQNPSLPSSSSVPSSQESRVSSFDLMPQDIHDDEIEKYRTRFPDKLKVDFYDAMILYQDSDLNAVEKFLKRVNSEVKLNNVEKPKVVLYDQILPGAPGMPRIGELDKTLEYCTYVFLYVTKTFCEDKWTEFSAQTALMNAIDNVESRWSVVPIFTEPKRKPTFKVPPSIRSLKGIQYWNEDKFYVDSLRKLLEDKLHLRLQQEEELRRERKKWIREYKISEKRKAEFRSQEEQHAMKQEAEREKQHQQKLWLEGQNFEQRLKLQQKDSEQQRKMSIPSIQEVLHQYKGYASHRPEQENYFYKLYSHMVPPGAATSERSELAEGKLDQQGMAELPNNMRHSFSMPNYLCDQFSNPTLSRSPQSAEVVPQQTQRPQLYPADEYCKSAPQSAGFGHADITSSSTLPLSSQSSTTGSFPKSHIPATANTSDKRTEGLPSVPVQPGAAQPSKQQQETSALESLFQTYSITKPSELPSDEKSLGSTGGQAMNNAKDPAAPPSAQDIPGHGSSDNHGNTSQNLQERTPELPHKDDLVVDVPHDSHSHRGPFPAHYPKGTGQIGPQYLSEARQQPVLLTQGPAHYGASRARAEPDERGDHRYDLHPRYNPNPGISRFQGYTQPQFPYMIPPPFPGQLPPRFLEQSQSPYIGHLPGSYIPGHYPLEYPRMYPYPEHFQQSPYALYPGYGYQRYPPQGAFPAHRMENLQYPEQYPPTYQPPLPASAPTQVPSHQQEQSQPPQQSENSPPAVVHHHHYHHNRGEEAPPATINYIKKAEHVMVGSEIHMGKTRRPERMPRTGDELQSMPEDMSSPENQSSTEYQSALSSQGYDQQSRDLTRSEAMASGPSAAFTSQQSTLTAFRESIPAGNPSQLTQNVSRDDRSRQLPSVHSAGLAAPEGLPELPSHRYQMNPRQMQASSSSSFSSAQYFTPHFQPGSGPGNAAIPSHILQQWPEQYQRYSETELKRCIVGPSDEESFLSEDSRNTSLKTRGSQK